MRNMIYTGTNGREGLYDLFPAHAPSERLIIFIHGYMGYKDWGAWNVLAQRWADDGYWSAKFNLTHNGTTIDKPTEFVDLEAFSKAAYTKDLADIQRILDLLEAEHRFRSFILVGHSRGGALALLTASDPRIDQVHCLAPISSIEARLPTGNMLEKWREDGVFYRKNGRTNQDMPHAYEQYTDFQENKEKLDVLSRCRQLTLPVFVYHGNNDSSVALKNGQEIARTCVNGQLHIIENADHTFGTKEPWTETSLSPKMQEVYALMLQNMINGR